jgi:hypothetical protein
MSPREPARRPRPPHRQAILLWLIVTCALIGSEFAVARITDLGLWMLAVPVVILLALWTVTEPDPVA